MQGDAETPIIMERLPAAYTSQKLGPNSGVALTLNCINTLTIRRKTVFLGNFKGFSMSINAMKPISTRFKNIWMLYVSPLNYIPITFCYKLINKMKKKIIKNWNHQPIANFPDKWTMNRKKVSSYRQFTSHHLSWR